MSNAALKLDHQEMVLLMVEAVTGMRRTPGITTKEAYGRLYQHDVDQAPIEKIEQGIAKITHYIRHQAYDAGWDVSE